MQTGIPAVVESFALYQFWNSNLLYACTYVNARKLVSGIREKLRMYEMIWPVDHRVEAPGIHPPPPVLPFIPPPPPLAPLRRRSRWFMFYVNIFGLTSNTLYISRAVIYFLSNSRWTRARRGLYALFSLALFAFSNPFRFPVTILNRRSRETLQKLIILSSGVAAWVSGGGSGGCGLTKTRILNA